MKNFLLNYNEKLYFVRSILFICIALISIFVMLSCKSAETPFLYRPYENLLAAIADLELYSKTDIYKLPVPKDLSGQNIFKASLVRLSNFKKINPQEFDEEIALASARCWLMLGDYENSSKYYLECIKKKGTLEQIAKSEWELLENMNNIIKEKSEYLNVDELIEHKKKQQAELKNFIEENKGNRFHTVGLIQAENIQVTIIELLKMNRWLLKNPQDTIIPEYKKLLADNKESKRYYEHVLSFADFYTSFAQEYVRVNPPEQGNFDLDIFRTYILNATELYSQVEMADGIAERKLAEKQIDSLIQFSRMIDERAK